MVETNIIASTITALASAWDASGGVSGISLYYGSAPQGTTGDYAVFYIEDDEATYTFTESYATYTVIFTVYTEDQYDPSDAITYTEALRSRYDNITTLTSDVGTLIDMRRQKSRGPYINPDGGYMQPTIYRISIEIL